MHLSNFTECIKNVRIFKQRSNSSHLKVIYSTTVRLSNGFCIVKPLGNPII